ncbi:pleckstrin homology domain-containing family M member 1 [Metopolophium dirhodum]|uniref:pleckstrin homology domain-containing family M member 1 n=1 Tax=Metopolophium dirhodum TaxID=44670 RepID=UPI00298FB7F4|nr:pleckstrin homology domain-containing family M member 1 [Metopolophium dirhodum]
MNKLLRKIISNKELKDESNKASIIHYFEERLNEFHSEFSDTDVKVTSSNYVADRLLANLEVLFLHGLKETFISQLSTVIGNDVDKTMDINFWHCLLVLSPSGVVDQINSLRHVTTDVGKCRAWIRCTLNDCVFRSYLMSAVKYRRYIIKFYNKTAIIRDHQCFEKIIALLESIDQYHFELTLNSSLLNTWPNSTLMLAGYWTPALKNNPLHNNNPQIAEAVDVNDTDEAILINDHNRSEESFTSSLSSSFVDSDFSRKPPITMDEETVWQLIMKQPSTSYATPSLTKDTIHSVDVLKENFSSCEISVTKPNDIVTKEEESSSEIPTSEQKTESLPNNEAKYDAQSFNELLESYNLRMKSSSVSPKMEDLYKQLTVPHIIEEQHFTEPETLDDDDDSFVEVSMHPERLSLDLLKQYLEYLFTPPKELGLNSQDFMCKSCNETIGIDFGEYFKCNFTACYYCVHCFGSETWAIPVKTLFNWDFNRYPVSNSSSTFLSEIQYHPLFNMRSIHHKLYKANKEMNKSKKLRWQIYYLYHYLSTCKFYNIDELSKDIWPRVYFFNNIHLYSFADLLEIYSGTLFEFLERKIETSRNHVHNCLVCSQKGFICELCRNPKIIYPFDLGDNYRCRHCKSLFHTNCYKEKNVCPKCERDKIRKMKKTSNSEDEDGNN